MSDKKQWHRLGGLVLSPLFTLLGYDPKVEIDLSLQKQILDLLVVRKGQTTNLTSLPKIYWEPFDELNEHNLITFKSYSESLNCYAVEELWGHQINYSKAFNVKRSKINLYAIAHYYPRQVLKPFEGTSFLRVVKEKEIFDLQQGNFKRVRIIVCNQTDCPLLALFSGDYEKVVASYQKLREETTLLDKVSVYLNRLSEYYGEEWQNMYTKEDFFRDYPPVKEHPFAFDWEVEYHQQELQRVREETQREAKETYEGVIKEVAERAAKEAAERTATEFTQRFAKEAARAAKQTADKMATETAKAMLGKGLSLTLISEITKLEQEVIRSLQESPEGASQKNGTAH